MAATNKAPPRPPRGTFFRVERTRGPEWFAKYRLPDGRQVQRKISDIQTTMKYSTTHRGRRCRLGRRTVGVDGPQAKSRD
jgi:hypothetical protein